MDDAEARASTTLAKDLVLDLEGRGWDRDDRHVRARRRQQGAEGGRIVHDPQVTVVDDAVHRGDRSVVGEGDPGWVDEVDHAVSLAQLR
jgi:hypothetical protein